MARLVVFGDSNTYGEHLEGYNVPTIPNGPSRLAWPSKLSELTRLPVINNAIPGFGYKAIWNSINKFSFLNTDILVILWPPGNTRIEYINDDQLERIRIYYDGKSQIYFRYFYNEYDQIITDLITRDHVYFTYYNTVAKIISIVYKLNTENSDLYKSIKKTYPKLATSEIAPFDMYELVKKYPNQYAFDNEHHNEFIHNLFAHQVFEHYFK